MRLIDADKLKKHYAWWECTELGKQNKQLFDDIVDAQPTIEKETPKKVFRPIDGYTRSPIRYLAACPCCHQPFEEGYTGWKSKYCSDCGQKLEWEEGEEKNEG